MRGKRGGQPLRALAVRAPQPPEQRVVIAHREKQPGRALVVRGGMAKHQSPQCSQFADQFAVSHDEADADARRERLRQAAHVDDVAAPVEALQRGLRTPFQPELHLVVVFDQDAVARIEPECPEREITSWRVEVFHNFTV